MQDVYSAQSSSSEQNYRPPARRIHFGRWNNWLYMNETGSSTVDVIGTFIQQHFLNSSLEQLLFQARIQEMSNAADC